MFSSIGDARTRKITLIGQSPLRLFSVVNSIFNLCHSKSIYSEFFLAEYYWVSSFQFSTIKVNRSLFLWLAILSISWTLKSRFQHCKNFPFVFIQLQFARCLFFTEQGQVNIDTRLTRMRTKLFLFVSSFWSSSMWSGVSKQRKIHGLSVWIQCRTLQSTKQGKSKTLYKMFNFAPDSFLGLFWLSV